MTYFSGHMHFNFFPLLVSSSLVTSLHPVFVTAKILRLRLTQKLNNHRGSDVRGDRQFELSLQND